MPAKNVTVSATFTDTRIVYDFAAAAEAGENPENLNGSAANGQAFYVWENSGKTDSQRQDFKGYQNYTGTNLPAECHVWRRSDRINGNVADGGLKCPNDREMVIDGIAAGSKIVIEYDATNAADGSKEIVWASATGDGHKTVAVVGTSNKAAISGTTTIASGAAITIASTECGYFGFKVKKNMVITKITISEGTAPTDVVMPNTITVAEGIENGTVAVSAAEAFEGDEITVTTTPAEGFKLGAITVKDADNAEVTVTDGKFTMPAKNVTVSATFVAVPKFYIIGINNVWDRTAMTEMTNNKETGKYEYEFAPTTTAYFAFADYQQTEEEATADADWSVFNSTYRYSIGEGNVDATLGETKSLSKVNGTIVLQPGTYKIVVESDFSAVTITGEVAPEPEEDTYVVAGAPASLFGTEWDGTAEANKMTKNETTGLYEKKYEGVVFAAATTIEYKIVKNGNTWIPDGTGNNQTVAIEAPGTYDVVFTFNPETNAITGVATIATGIYGISVDASNDIFSDGKPVYNLSGQRVFKGYKGIVIKNGRKVVVK